MRNLHSSSQLSGLGLQLRLESVLVNQEGAFQGTRSKVAIPYDYGQPSSSTGAVSPTPLRSFFPWSDDEEASGSPSSATISLVRTGLVPANMADNNDDDLHRRMEAQVRTSRAQQKVLDNIQQMLAQLLVNRNTNDTNSNHNEYEHNNDERPKTDKSKESSSIDVDVIKGIQAQSASWPRGMS